MTRVRRFGLVLTLVAGAGLVSASLAQAAPANDNFPGQTLAGLPTSTSGTNVDATKQSGEPDHAGDAGGKSVWYSWTAPSSGRVDINTCNSGFDTLLGVYTGGAVNALTAVASNDDASGCGAGGSALTFDAASGTTYRIAVDGHDFGSGPDEGNLDLRLAAVPPPPPPPPQQQQQSGPSATGQRAAALKKCKKKKGAIARKKCKQKANKLPV